MQQKKELLATISMIEKLNKKLDIQNRVIHRAVPIVVLDEQGKFIEANDNYCKNLGYSFLELKNRSIKDFLGREGSKKFTDLLKTIGDDENWQGELSLLRSDKSKLYVDAVFVPIENDIGEKNIFSIQFDITQKKINEAELEKKNIELARLNQLKNMLFSIVSHDFRSPLKTLQGTLQLANRGVISTEELKTHTENILSKVDKTAEFLDNLLNWAKSQMAGARLKPEKLDLYDVTDEIIELIQPQADNKEITIKNMLRHSCIVADLEMVKLVLRNLLSNAVKFTKTGGEVRIEGKLLERSLQVAIVDDGIGMDKNQLERLFELENYSTLGTANELGAGLGLILCKDFITKNKGEIWAKSGKGKGSTFYFTLPLLDQNQQLHIDSGKSGDTI